MTTIEALSRREAHVGVVGLGYVGTPLMAALHRHFSVYGFDTDQHRVASLQHGVDMTRAADACRIRDMSERFTTDAAVLRRCSLIIVAVPTPVTPEHQPDLEALRAAARTVGRNIQRGTVVIVESTVYPGVTEEVVGAIVADESGLVAGAGFHLGYSPERINPGDSGHTVERLVKVVAGESTAVTDLLTAVYERVTEGGVHQAASIRTAEAAKIMENTQRDLNIALMNELAMICERLGLETGEVIRTASTKWNFARYEPGLVGGHCIGVDPYYLTYVAEDVGLTPRVILAGRYVNDSMGEYVAKRTLDLIRMQIKHRNEVRALILGITFKEDIPDVRNSRVVDIVRVLEKQNVVCSIFDPHADPHDVRDLYGLGLLDNVGDGAPYDAVIVAVRHEEFATKFPLNALRAISVDDGPVLVDVKSVYDRETAELAGFGYWRL